MINEKDIVKKTGIVFKPDMTPDPKPFHPAVILLKDIGQDGAVYYLTLTSQILRYQANAGQQLTQYYFLLHPGMPKPSLVNLDYIYKADNVSDLKMTTLDATSYQRIVRDLKKRQDFLSSTQRGADEFYEEIKESIR